MGRDIDTWERLQPRLRATIGEKPPPPGMRLGKAIALAEMIRHQFGVQSAQPVYVGNGWYQVGFTYRLRPYFVKGLAAWDDFAKERELRPADYGEERDVRRYMARDDDGNVG